MPSDSLISLLPTSPVSSTDGTAESASAASRQKAGSSQTGQFGNLLQGMRSPPSGNASPVLSDTGGKDLPLPDLTRFNQLEVSSQVQIITSAMPPPDNQSLMSFARAQGIDESVLQRLLNPQGAAFATGMAARHPATGAAIASAGAPAGSPASAGSPEAEATAKSAATLADALPATRLTSGMSSAADAMSGLGTKPGIEAASNPEASPDPDAEANASADQNAAGSLLLALSGLLAQPAQPAVFKSASTTAANSPAGTTAGEPAMNGTARVPAAPSLAGFAAQTSVSALPVATKALSVDTAARALMPAAPDRHGNLQRGASLAGRVALPLEVSSAPPTPPTSKLQTIDPASNGSLQNPPAGLTSLAALSALTGLKAMTGEPATPVPLRTMRPAWASPAQPAGVHSAQTALSALQSTASPTGSTGITLSPPGLNTSLAAGAAAAPSTGNDHPDAPAQMSAMLPQAALDAGFSSAQVATYDLPEPLPLRSEAGAATTSVPGERYQAVVTHMAEAVARQINTAIDNGHWRVEMHINPPRMGQIDITLSSTANGALDAQFTASQSHTRQLLTDALPHLKEALAGAGIASGQLEVSPGQASTSDASSYSGQPAFQQSFNQNTRQETALPESPSSTTNEAPPEDSTPRLAPASGASPGLLDVLA